MKKSFSTIMAAVLVVFSFTAYAQEAGKIPRIGFFPSGGDANQRGTQTKAFRQELRDLGYVEGKSVLVEYRYVGAEPDRVPSIVAELLKLQVDVLVVGSPGAVQAAKKASKTIPIVFAITQDPVAAGSVDSLA